MVSVTKLFENFLIPWHNIKFKVRMKKRQLPSTPTSMFRDSFSRIKKMNSKLKALNKQSQR